MLTPSSRRRPLGRTIVHVAVVLSLAFGTLAAAGGYWAVVKGPELVRSPYDPAVIAAARTVPRGAISDRAGEWLARNEEDANGELTRVYRSRALSQVVGYASSRYGRAGLELAFDAELSGLAGDPVGDALRKFGSDPYDPKDLTLSLSYDLQRAAVRALGDFRGAVVMLDPVMARSWPLPPHRPMTLRRSPTRPRRRRPSRRSAATRVSHCCRGPRWAATCRAPSSRS